jgi:hypothetical protein
MKKLLVSLAIALLLTITISMTALATQPEKIEGIFYNFIPGNYPLTYCLTTFDGFFDGCVIQPYHDGLGAKGTFIGTVDGKSGTCEYNLRTFDIDGIARFVMNRCTGDLKGFQMQGTGWAATGSWEGYYHFDP